jgi:hypothetical protein
MSYNIPGCSVVTTKQASGNVRFDFYDLVNAQTATYQGPVSYSAGNLRFSCVMTAANVTAINTTVNGGATGTNLTQNYAQDANQGDYLPNCTVSRV